MSKLILHIGSHKTGTTSIQHALRAWQDSPNRPADQTFVEIHRSPYFPGETDGTGEDFRAIISEDMMRARLAKGSDTTVMSSEFFSWLFHEEDVAQIAALKRLIDEVFDEVQIVVYLRRQDFAANAHQNQVRILAPASRAFGVTLGPLPEISDNLLQYLDYSQRMQGWIDVFGRDAITLRIYDESRLLNGDAVADFASVTGIDLSGIEVGTYNQTVGSTEMLLTLATATAGMGGKIQNRIFNSFEPGPKLLPTRAEAEAFLSIFKASNDRLCEMFGEEARFPDSLEMYPETISYTQAEVSYLLETLAVAIRNRPKLTPEQAEAAKRRAQRLKAKQLQAKHSRTRWTRTRQTRAKLLRGIR